MKVSEIFSLVEGEKLSLPLVDARISAGFPSPAEDHIEKKLDLNDLLISNPAATFFVRVEGESMIDAGIQSGDILIVDKAMEAKSGSIVVAVLNGEFTVKRMEKGQNFLRLVAENPKFQDIEVTEDMDFRVWGVVTNVIHNLK